MTKTFSFLSRLLENSSRLSYKSIITCALLTLFSFNVQAQVDDGFDPLTPTPEVYKTYWDRIIPTKSAIIPNGDYIIAIRLDRYFPDSWSRRTYAICEPASNLMAQTEYKCSGGRLVYSTGYTFHIEYSAEKKKYSLQFPNGKYLSVDDKSYSGAVSSETPTYFSIDAIIDGSDKYYSIHQGSSRYLKSYSKTWGITPGYMDNLIEQRGEWDLFQKTGDTKIVEADDWSSYNEIDKTNKTATLVRTQNTYGKWTMPKTVTIDGETYTYTAIGAYALAGTDITEAYIPECVTTIDDYAFEGCKKLKDVKLSYDEVSEAKLRKAQRKAGELPTVTIGEGAFSGCSTLTVFECGMTTPPSIGTDAFDGVNGKCIIVVPAEAKEAYKSAMTMFSDIRSEAPSEADEYKTSYLILQDELTNLEYENQDLQYQIIQLNNENSHLSKGDLDLDGKVTISDVTKVVDAVLEK